MMRKLAWYASFQRAYRKWLRKDPRWQGRIFEALELLSADTFAPKLKTHKLKGQLEGLWACWVEYDFGLYLLLNLIQMQTKI